VYLFGSFPFNEFITYIKKKKKVLNVVWVGGVLVYVCVSAVNNFTICGFVGHVSDKKYILFKKLSLWFVD
jgi:hypothetical protein